jgi:predicted Zn-dependent peptidase
LAELQKVLDEVKEKGIGEAELEQLKVKFRSDYYSMLEGGHGSHIPRYGLMHCMACFTLFDNEPRLVNTVLDGFLAVTPAAVQAVANKYLVPAERSIVYRQPVAKVSA